MGNVRRTTYAFFSLEDEYAFDAASLLRGIIPSPVETGRIDAVAVLTGERRSIGREEWEVLTSIPIDVWVDEEGFDRRVIRDLLDKALLLSDSTDSPFRELRERDEALTASAWHPYAALYHFATKWSGVTIAGVSGGDGEFAAETATAVRDLVAEYGPPPSELSHVRSTHTVALPARARCESFFRTLMERRTTRTFDLDRPMSLDDLDTTLRYVFGCHGYASVPGVVCIKRTSPSGGGLHPVTAYPVISNVKGIAPGVYHYNAGDHSLALLEPLGQQEARILATTFTCGQGHFGTAHVCFLLVARFYRSHWKYRQHPRAYAGILMDAAHLSQTLYLVATELGLGAYVTIVINGRDIEARLGLDGIDEGVVAVCGCGPRSGWPSSLEPKFTAERPAGS
ncbi:MAG: putative peptide maturation dehydrogenase [Solirubrobacterales bacterium]|nr:putative peptide maturation dehydrogenase [Solirubrobacterales bacterium]